MRRFKETGPAGVVRPFAPTIDLQGDLSEEERQTEALEHIAVCASAIDHNIEVVANHLARIVASLAQK